MNTLFKNFKILTLTFLVILFNSCMGNRVEENALLDTMKFGKMNLAQKTEVLEKIIEGKIDPYKTENLKISLKLNGGHVSSKNLIFWDGKVLDANNGLVEIETNGRNVKREKLGLLYFGKGLHQFIKKEVLDSLVIGFRNPYEKIDTSLTKDERLLKVKNKLRGSGSIKNASISNKTVSIDYVNGYTEYKKLQPQSSVSEEELKSYWSGGDAILKTLIEASGRVLLELDFSDMVIIKLPFEGKVYQIKVSTKQLERYTNTSKDLLLKGWSEYFVDKYVYDKLEREKFFRKFGRII